MPRKPEIELHEVAKPRELRTKKQITNDEIAAILERYAERAKRGEFRGLSIVAVFDDPQRTTLHNSRFLSRIELLGALDLAAAEARNDPDKWGEVDDSDAPQGEID